MKITLCDRIDANGNVVYPFYDIDVIFLIEDNCMLQCKAF
jgi:hypothetical protein